jgi:hypothetical protein
MKFLEKLMAIFGYTIIKNLPEQSCPRCKMTHRPVVARWWHRCIATKSTKLSEEYPPLVAILNSKIDENQNF